MFIHYMITELHTIICDEIIIIRIASEIYQNPCSYGQ